MAETRAQKILQILRKTYAMPKLIASNRDPFKTLIVTIISQNTADRNTAKAFEKLSKTFAIKPEVLANADTSKIEECLKVAGLQRNKARAIKQVSRIVLNEFHGGLSTVLSLPLGEARETLLKLPGIGPKTADVVLLFCAEKPTIPVDTHVGRLAKRLGFASADAGYEKVRASLQELFVPEDYLTAHVLLIEHGRRYCKAREPLCTGCPIDKFCPSKSRRVPYARA
jgi:endonuclease-3